MIRMMIRRVIIARNVMKMNRNGMELQGLINMRGIETMMKVAAVLH
jgi:hypothetical protein